ncbi:MAG: radical SAM protein [Actinomycetota bacterium]
MPSPFVLKDASVVLNGVDLSDHVKQVETPYEVAAQDATAMGSSTKKSIPGLKDAKVSLTFLQDFATAKVDATIWPLYNAGTSFVLVIKPTSAAVSATNPSYTQTVFVKNYNPISGAVGSIADVKIDFEISSGDVVRATT